LFLDKSWQIPSAADFLDAAALDLVDIGYRRLHREGRNVRGAYAELVTTSSRWRTGRGAASGGDAGGEAGRRMRKIIGERPRATVFKGAEADEEKLCAAKTFEGSARVDSSGYRCIFLPLKPFCTSDIVDLTG
jgi:hypothetical protein